MYQRILLAYDGSIEGRLALREGALLARRCGARIFLLSIVAGTRGLQIAEAVQAGCIARGEETYKAVLQEGIARLKALGFDPVAKLVTGEPGREIAAFASEVRADLVIVGHRKQGALSRWWSGSTGAYLTDQISCSVLFSRSIIDDEAFQIEAQMLREPAL